MKPVSQGKTPFIDGGVCAPRGYEAAGVKAGIKPKLEKKDLCLLVSQKPALAAGMYTSNLVKAPALMINRENIAKGRISAIVANSGNANSCTGSWGEKDTYSMMETAASLLGCKAQEVLVASTGVIGVRLPMDKITSGIKEAYEQLSPGGGENAAVAIMTTDTRPKQAAVSLQIDEHTLYIGGMAKGSGMIHPNMATLLVFLTTDAMITSDALNGALKAAVDRSFNMVSIDGDMSTNDMVLMLANGLADNPTIEKGSEEASLFTEALTLLCIKLAKEIASDGEGATKLVEIQVSGAESPSDAKLVARSISNSNLVKTAIHGADANWGRILAAAGYSEARFDPDKVSIYLGDIQVFHDGQVVAFDEDSAKEYLLGTEVLIKVCLGTGSFQATAWTCDLTSDYIKINASYRT
jgi:glutamate N-acetyltransferase/amino-acid N-acetyltransferase